jgi:hypothetical protein
VSRTIVPGLIKSDWNKEKTGKQRTMKKGRRNNLCQNPTGEDKEPYRSHDHVRWLNGGLEVRNHILTIIITGRIRYSSEKPHHLNIT